MKYNVFVKDGVDYIEVTSKDLVFTLCANGASIYDITYNGKSLVYKEEDFYISGTYAGKTVGRYAGRIKDANYTINGKTYYLDKNFQGHSCLHGGDDSIAFKIGPIIDEKAYLDKKYANNPYYKK